MLKKLSLLGLSLMLAFYPTVALAAENDEQLDSEQIEDEAKSKSETKTDEGKSAEQEGNADDPEIENEEEGTDEGDSEKNTKEDAKKDNDSQTSSNKEDNVRKADEGEKADNDQVEEEKITKIEEETKEDTTEEEKQSQTLVDKDEEGKKEVDAVKNKQVDGDLDLSNIYGTANANNDSPGKHGITYDFNKGYYVLDLQAGLFQAASEEGQTINNKWVAFALPNGVDVADKLPSGVVRISVPGHTGLAVKIPNLTSDDSSKYVNPKIPLRGEVTNNDPNLSLYLYDVDTSSNTYENLGQLKSERNISFSVMEANPQIDLHGSIAGKAEFDNDKGYYMLNVAVKAQNQTDSNVNDLYAGFELPEGVEVLSNDDMPANVEKLKLDDGTRVIALKLPELSTDREREVSYQIPVLGESTEVVEASTINAYKINGTYQPVGQYQGSINVDFSEMKEQWDFNAQSQIVKDFPGLDKDQFGLRFSFKTQNLTLDNVDKVKVEFKVPGDITVHEPDEYTQGSIPDSMKDFLEDRLNNGSLDLEWNGNTAIIDLETVDGMSGYEGFFTAFGESSKALNDLEGIEVLVTLYQNGNEVAKEINVPFEIVPYEGDETEEPEEPGKGEDDKNTDDGANKGKDDNKNDDNKDANQDNNKNDNDKQAGNDHKAGEDKVNSNNNDNNGSKKTDDDQKNGANNVNADDNDDDGVTISGKNDSNSNGPGWELPDTATNMFNLLLFGSILTVAGGALMLFRKRKLAQN